MLIFEELFRHELRQEVGQLLGFITCVHITNIFYTTIMKHDKLRTEAPFDVWEHCWVMK